jgi:hypothetical protein
MRLHIIAAAVLFSAALSAHADSVFNFESTASGTALPLVLTSNGLTAVFNGSASVCSAASFGITFSLLSGNVLIQNLCSSNAVSPLGITFSQTLNSLSFDYATAQGSSPLTVTLFDGATQIGSEVFTPTLIDGFGNGEGLASITGTFTTVTLSDSRLLAIDNVDAVATPEPSSFALLGTGLLGFAGIVRRRFS